MSKLDELKEKFEGFVDDLKSKLPLKRGDDDEYEDDEDEFEENTSKVNVDPNDLEEDITESKTLSGVEEDDDTSEDIAKKAASDSEEDEEDEEDEEEDEDAKKAKIKTWAIRGAILVLVAVLAMDFLVPTDDNTVPDVPVVKKKRKRPKRKRKKKVADSEKQVAPKMEEKVVAKATPEPPKATPIPTAEPVPTVVATPEKKEMTPAIVETPRPTPAPTVVEKAESIPPETPNEPLKVEVPNTLSLGENTDSAKPSLTMDEQVDKILKKTKDSEKGEMKTSEEKIDSKMDYVAPPNYKRLGRGLVYNCIGKHWACVDKFSFFQCLENRKWSTVNKKDPECVTNNVYASDQDCATVQTHYINTREATEFCNTMDKKSPPEPSTKVVVP